MSEADETVKLTKLDAAPVLQTREEWLEMRRTGLGSSDVAKVLGVHPTKTPYDVYCEKRGLVEDQEASERMEWGKAFEQVIARVWAQKRNTNVIWRDKTVPGPEPWTFATPDFELTEHEGGECKNIGHLGDDWGQQETDEIPLQYAAQSQWVLMVTGWDRLWLPVLAGGNKLHTYVVGADRNLQAAMLTECRKFWTEHVAPGVPPPIDWSDSADRYLRYRFPVPKEPPRPAEPEELALIQDFATVRAARKRIEKQFDTLANQLKEKIGDAKAIVGEDFKLTWYARKESSYMVTRPAGRVLKPGGPLFAYEKEGEDAEAEGV